MSTKKDTFDYVFKYIIIGDMGVGKSCLLAQFTEHKFLTDSQHTIGVEFGTKVIDINGTKAKLQIWDTAGQERFKAVCRSYYRGASGALLVYDVTRRSTFQHLLNWLNDAKVLTSPNTVMLMIGNKTDLDGSREVSYEEASNFAAENNLTYIETSSKTGENVNECFTDVGRRVLEAINSGKDVPVEANNTTKSNATVGSTGKNETANGGCC